MESIGGERELVWYDVLRNNDTTYDIGYFNYYQRTIDPGPWAFIVSFLFCITLAMLLPLYLSYHRSAQQRKLEKETPSTILRESRHVIFGCQQFIASDADFTEIYQRTVLGNDPKTPLAPVKEERIGAPSITDDQGEIARTEYTSMEDASEERPQINAHRGNKFFANVSTEASMNDVALQTNGYGELLDECDSESQSRTTITSNPFLTIKKDLKDFAKGGNVNDSLSIASSWEEVFDTVAQTTFYMHPITGRKTTQKPIEPLSEIRSPWYMFYTSSGFRRKIRKCARWDDEMEKILGLALPYSIHTIAVEIFGLLEVGIVGRLLGTSALSAYFATEFAISFATMFFYGILSSLKVLVSQAHGADNIRLAGTYVQIGVWMHHLFSLPLVLYGWDHFDDIALALGLNEEAAEIADKYARVALVYEAIGIYDRALHLVFDVTGHEKYSAIMNAVRAFFNFVTVCIISRSYKATELWMIGAIHLAGRVLFFLFNLCVMFYMKWLDNYWSELSVNNPFQDWTPIRTLWKASIRLSSGRVIENCEWNILFVFAAIQGAADVAVWGLVGKLWDFADNIVIAVSDGSKVRCAHLLGSGLPEQAKYSAEKSLFLGVVVSLILSTSLGVFRPVIPEMLTSDFTLQRLLANMIPMICLAVATLSFGSICLSILCAQGRAHLATAVSGFGTLMIALPLATLSNFWFNLNLQGLISCLIIGYASSGFFNSVLVLTSNWTKISYKVRKKMIRTEEKIEKNKAAYADSFKIKDMIAKNEET